MKAALEYHADIFLQTSRQLTLFFALPRSTPATVLTWLTKEQTLLKVPMTRMV